MSRNTWCRRRVATSTDIGFYQAHQSSTMIYSECSLSEKNVRECKTPSFGLGEADPAQVHLSIELVSSHSFIGACCIESKILPVLSRHKHDWRFLRRDINRQKSTKRGSRYTKVKDFISFTYITYEGIQTHECIANIHQEIKEHQMTIWWCARWNFQQRHRKNSRQCSTASLFSEMNLPHLECPPATKPLTAPTRKPLIAGWIRNPQ